MRHLSNKQTFNSLTLVCTILGLIVVSAVCTTAFGSDLKPAAYSLTKCPYTAKTPYGFQRVTIGGITYNSNAFIYTEYPANTLSGCGVKVSRKFTLQGSQNVLNGLGTGYGFASTSATCLGGFPTVSFAPNQTYITPWKSATDACSKSSVSSSTGDTVRFKVNNTDAGLGYFYVRN
jgi:hypothetical protein